MQRVARKSIQRVCNDHRLDARILHIGLLRNFPGCDIAAHGKRRRVLANRQACLKIWLGARQHQDGIRAARKTEGADLGGVHARLLWPGGGHVVDYASYLTRARREDRQIPLPRTVLRVVAHVVDGGHHEARIRQRRGGVVMAQE
ncbi:hypothetical protein D3C71_1258120 [compost metagenome]